jgi:hypothetical protein
MVAQRYSGPPDVTLQEPLGVHRVSADDRVEDEPVLGVHDPHPVRPAQCDVGAPVVLRGVPQSRDHRVERADVATGVGPEVELPVEVEESVEVGVLLDLLLHVLEVRVVVIGQLGQALRHRQRLEPLSHPVDHVDLMHRQPWHPSALVGLVLREALGLQHAERDTHR